MVMALLRLDVPLSKTKDGSALDVVNALLEGEDGTSIACPSPCPQTGHLKTHAILSATSRRGRRGGRADVAAAGGAERADDGHGHGQSGRHILTLSLCSDHSLSLSVK